MNLSSVCSIVYVFSCMYRLRDARQIAAKQALKSGKVDDGITVALL